MSAAFNQIHLPGLMTAPVESMLVGIRLTYAAAGVITVESPLNEITGSYLNGVATLALPTAPRGYIVGAYLQSPLATVDQLLGTSYNVATGALVFTTFKEDVGGILVATNPAAGDVVYLTLLLCKTSSGY